MKLVPKTKGLQSSTPQHQKGIELGPVSDSGIASISNCGCFYGQGSSNLPADDGKGPHATSSSGLPPLGLNKRMIHHFTRAQKKHFQFLKAE